jgi:hypothetical protein
VNIAFRKRDIFFGFEIELGGKRIGSALTFNRSAIGFNVNDVTNFNTFLLERFVDGRIQLELLCSFSRLQSNDYMTDSFAISCKTNNWL